jgi:outer membrane protein
VLDFGVSYYRAQQKADQILMAEERRRKVIQNVLQDVRNSLLAGALGAQRLIRRSRNRLLDAHRQGARARAKKAEDRGTATAACRRFRTSAPCSTRSAC